LQEEEPDVCCICLDELSTDINELMRYTCCGKACCLGCHNNVMKSKMPDDLKNRCHQCRKPNPKTNEEAVKRIREWVVKGKVWAQRMLAGFYKDGACGVEQSYVMAAMLYEKAVDQGDSGAMVNLGCMYRNGKGVAQSYIKAVEFYTMAAENGDVDAMNNLGTRYIQGQGVDQSNELAREWWTKAANEGFEDAIENLKTLDKQEGKSTT